MKGEPTCLLILTQGKETIIDAIDDWTTEFKWSLSHYGYAMRKKPRTKGGILYLHREIMNAQPGQDVDHKDGNRLNNRRSNLRLCTRVQNLYNKPVRSDNKLGIKGVRQVPSGKYEARINKKRIGLYGTIRDAAMAYNAKALELHGEYANINILEIT